MQSVHDNTIQLSCYISLQVSTVTDYRALNIYIIVCDPANLWLWLALKPTLKLRASVDSHVRDQMHVCIVVLNKLFHLHIPAQQRACVCSAFLSSTCLTPQSLQQTSPHLSCLLLAYAQSLFRIPNISHTNSPPVQIIAMAACMLVGDACMLVWCMQADECTALFT